MFSCQCVGEEKFRKEKVGWTFFCYKKKVYLLQEAIQKQETNIAVKDVVVS
jgi:hypothetical protein